MAMLDWGMREGDTKRWARLSLTGCQLPGQSIGTKRDGEEECKGGREGGRGVLGCR